MGYEDRVKAIEDEMRKMQYNKRTQHHYGLLRAKLAKLKTEQFKRSSGGKKGEGYSVRKSGDATVVLLGFPSAGKSTLLNSMTGTESKVGAYAFTTLDVIPGTLEHKHAKMQVLDVPGIVHGAASGKGRGREVLSVIRSADLILMIVDAHSPQHLKALRREVYDSGVRINKELPIVKIAKKPKGGLDIASTIKLTKIDKKTVTAIFREYKINNADVVIRSNIDIEELIDVIEANRVYIPAAIILNKIDSVDEEQLQKVVDMTEPDLCISAMKEINIDRLKDLIYDKLNLISVYCKEVGKPADMDVPLVMKKGITVRDMCRKLHKDFVTKFKFARVWGPSAKFPGQKFMLKHKLKDGDVIELHIS